MRLLIVAAAGAVLLSLGVGCCYKAGKCDCDQTPTITCSPYGSSCAGSVIAAPPSPVLRPTPIGDAPKPLPSTPDK